MPEDEELDGYEEKVSVVEGRATVVVADNAPKVACLGGCGKLVGVGQKCVECATKAVHQFYADREQRRQDAIAARAKKPLPSIRKAPAPKQQGTKQQRGRRR